MNLNTQLISRHRPEIMKAVLPFNFFENNAHKAGSNKGPPVMAAIVSTTSIMPPAAGTSNAIPLRPKPSNSDESRATIINDLSEAWGLNIPL